MIFPAGSIPAARLAAVVVAPALLAALRGAIAAAHALVVVGLAGIGAAARQDDLEPPRLGLRRRLIPKSGDGEHGEQREQQAFQGFSLVGVVFGDHAGMLAHLQEEKLERNCAALSRTGICAYERQTKVRTGTPPPCRGGGPACHDRRMSDAAFSGEALFGALFEQSAVGIAAFSIGGRFLRANPAFCRLLGYTEQELLQKTHLDVIHGEDLEAAAVARARVISGR